MNRQNMLNHLWSLLVAAMLGLSASAQDTRPVDGSPPPQPPPQRDQPTRPRFDPNNFPVPENTQLVRDVVYATAQDKDGHAVDLKMDCAFLKESDGKPMPVIVYIHGGGWQGGDRAIGVPLSVAFAQGGYFTCTIDYRLSQQAIWPAQIHDVKAAVRFIRANAEKLAIDPERIGVWGHSAGGHLSAMLGTTGNVAELEGDVGEKIGSSAVQAVVDMCGPTDLLRIRPGGDAGPIVEALIGGTIVDKRERAVQASPVSHVDAKDAPFLIVHGGQDRLVPPEQAEVMRDALKTAGVEVEYLLLEDADHGLTDRRVYRAAAEFFDKHLHGGALNALAEYQKRLPGAGDARPRRPNADPAPASQPAGTGS